MARYNPGRYRLEALVKYATAESTFVANVFTRHYPDVVLGLTDGAMQIDYTVGHNPYVQTYDGTGIVGAMPRTTMWPYYALITIYVRLTATVTDETIAYAIAKAFKESGASGVDANQVASRMTPCPSDALAIEWGNVLMGLGGPAEQPAGCFRMQATSATAAPWRQARQGFSQMAHTTVDTSPAPPPVAPPPPGPPLPANRTPVPGQLPTAVASVLPVVVIAASVGLFWWWIHTPSRQAQVLARR